MYIIYFIKSPSHSPIIYPIIYPTIYPITRYLPLNQAGITTTLNTRCSVLAAANSVFGRWDDTKGEENIEFMPTILSRFDMIFIVKDVHDSARDVVSSSRFVWIIKYIN